MLGRLQRADKPILPNYIYINKEIHLEYIYIRCLNIHWPHMTADNNVMFFFVSDLKIVHDNNY